MTGPWSCSGCDNRWGGLVAQHCPACHHTFTGTGSGDAHRTPDFRCLPPADAGLVRRANGVWGSPISDKDRERLAAHGWRKAHVPIPDPRAGISGPDSPGPMPESPPAPFSPAEANQEAP